MSEDESFADFLQRVRAGDEDAAAELLRRYEPVIRVYVRRRLNDPSLHSIFDSVDICQSVLTSFFVRARLGQFDLDQPEQLLGLLVAMARNKLAMRSREQHRQRRDARRRVANSEEVLQECGAGRSPASLVAGRDLLQAVRDRLTEEERRLADLRLEGRTWPEIAALVGGEAQARRRQLDRALDRVSQELGLDEVGDE